MSVDFEQFDAFLCRPYFVRYSVIIAVSTILCFIIYMLLISPIDEQYQQTLFNYQSSISNIEILEEKIASYPSKASILNEIRRLNELRISSHDISQSIPQLLLKCQMKLIDLEREDRGNKVVYQLQFHGKYQHFIAFLQLLFEQKMRMEISTIKIVGKKNHLIFSLTIISDSKSE